MQLNDTQLTTSIKAHSNLKLMQFENYNNALSQKHNPVQHIIVNFAKCAWNKSTDDNAPFMYIS